ncbi:hypothetical protein DN752_06620 [Echinicola strongylocentroti]|uniref:DUF3299 domain-containing protein n=1 Tax=Echinicola strongylocentroti TaxID=1795355 RepID=A0A2Z4IGJ6_9BACT|nr:hypothetical protein [Echinicola strongylocentroti]AWW29817.1 hypothetical protein DN752_06620 [Echinicola strongylocentroti]
MKLKFSVIAVVLMAVCGINKAQDANVWKTLTGVTYEVGEDEYGELYLPVFSDDIQELEGKEISAEGYIIPFEGMFKPEHIILSSLPLAECFFCGSGGPETVMEVMMADPIEYTSKRVKVKGTLKLNAKDPEKLMYILTDAELVL